MFMSVSINFREHVVFNLRLIIHEIDNMILECVCLLLSTGSNIQVIAYTFKQAATRGS